MSRITPDVVVVGGGVLGASIAYHLARRGKRPAVVDRGLAGFSASAGNFGLVWVQDKSPAPYLTLSMLSAHLYPDFARELAEVAGLDIEYERSGGIHLCRRDSELEGRAAYLAAQARVDGFHYEMLDAAAVRRLEPMVGHAVVGASLCPLDGHVNPLALLRALHRGVVRLGGAIHGGSRVHAVEAASARRWVVRTEQSPVEAETLVLAAGVGVPALTAPLGLEVPVRPQRGQILVSEKLPPLVRHPSVPVRQSRIGTVFIGGTHEEVGFDTRTTAGAIRQIAADALDYFPFLGRAELLRSWGALRPLTPDGLPILEQPEEHPGLYLVTSHSGITLCPVVGRAFAEWITADERPGWLPRFERHRFSGIGEPLLRPAWVE